jgi:hypothetical protein
MSAAAVPLASAPHTPSAKAILLNLNTVYAPLSVWEAGFFSIARLFLNI